MTCTRIAAACTSIFAAAAFLSAQTTAPSAEPQSQAPAAALLIVPGGTSVPLTLITPIRSKSSKPGDTVRASVAFPVTVDSQLAIPAGSYVEGRVVSVAARAAGAGLATAQIRFDRLLFANGYSVSLDATGSQALSHATTTGELAWLDPAPGFPGEGLQYPAPPTLPPLPSVGPPKAAIIGGTAAGVGIVVLFAAISAHHRHHADYVLFDSGSQFRMVLQQPLTLDPVQVKAAIAAAATRAVSDPH